MHDFKAAAANDLDRDFERAIEFDDHLDDRRDKAAVSLRLDTENGPEPVVVVVHDQFELVAISGESLPLAVLHPGRKGARK